MLTAKLVAKTIAISLGVFVILVVALSALLAMGMPPAIVAPATWLSFAAFGYFQSKNLWNSRKPWAWALAGLFLGILAFPFFWFCHEHHQAAGENVKAQPEAIAAGRVEVALAPVPSLAEDAAPQSPFQAH